MKLRKRIKRALRRGYVFSSGFNALVMPVPAQVGNVQTRGVLPTGYKLPQSVPIPASHMHLVRSA